MPRRLRVGQLLRPYPQYTSVTIVPPDIGNSVYHSLQAKIVKRFRTGGTLLGDLYVVEEHQLMPIPRSGFWRATQWAIFRTSTTRGHRAR